MNTTKIELPERLMIYHGEICIDNDKLTPLELVCGYHQELPIQVELVHRWNSYTTMRVFIEELVNDDCSDLSDRARAVVAKLFSDMSKGLE